VKERGKEREGTEKQKINKTKLSDKQNQNKGKEKTK